MRGQQCGLAPRILRHLCSLSSVPPHPPLAPGPPMQIWEHCRHDAGRTGPGPGTRAPPTAAADGQLIRTSAPAKCRMQSPRT